MAPRVAVPDAERRSRPRGTTWPTTSSSTRTAGTAPTAAAGAWSIDHRRPGRPAAPRLRRDDGCATGLPNSPTFACPYFFDHRQAGNAAWQAGELMERQERTGEVIEHFTWAADADDLMAPKLLAMLLARAGRTDDLRRRADARLGDVGRGLPPDLSAGPDEGRPPTRFEMDRRRRSILRLVGAARAGRPALRARDVESLRARALEGDFDRELDRHAEKSAVTSTARSRCGVPGPRGRAVGRDRHVRPPPVRSEQEGRGRRRAWRPGWSPRGAGIPSGDRPFIGGLARRRSARSRHQINIHDEELPPTESAGLKFTVTTWLSDGCSLTTGRSCSQTRLLDGKL